MDWKEIKIHTTHENMDNLGAALISAGINGFVINDPEDIREFAAEKNASWDYIDDDLLRQADAGGSFITVYLESGESGAIQAEQMSEALDRLRGMGVRLRVESCAVREEDWANEWKKFFKPQPIGRKIIIKPTWETVPDPAGRTVIELDPETSFGTGRHFTTQLALELLEDNLNLGDTVADLGCGSGIIFISAMKLGASHAVGTDISSDAIKISRKNAAQNGISDSDFEVFCGDVVTDPELLKKFCKGYDLVAANIVADVLISMKDVFKMLVKPGGKLILSGIIDDRLDETLAAVKASGFTLIEHRRRDIWNAASFVKG